MNLESPKVQIQVTSKARVAPLKAGKRRSGSLLPWHRWVSLPQRLTWSYWHH